MIRNVQFLAQQGADDLYRCIDNGKIFIRQRCDKEYVRWLTTSKWPGGFEPDMPLRGGLVIRILDPDGTCLFVEQVYKEPGYDGTVAKKEAPFFDDACNHMATTIREECRLLTYDQWKTWLMEAAAVHGYKDYGDNWCFAEVEYGPIKTAAKDYRVLGKELKLTVQKATHKICGYSWDIYMLHTSGNLWIVGYDK